MPRAHRRIDRAHLPPKPVWSNRRRCLRWRGQQILQVAEQASSARAVLREFQRQGWPPTIVSPIKHCFAHVAAKRRRNAVYLLNKYQRTPERPKPVIEFHSLPGNRIAWFPPSSDRGIDATNDPTPRTAPAGRRP